MPSMKKFYGPGLALLIFLLILAAPCGAARAHVTANPDTAPAGGWFRTALRISHGCNGSATTTIRVDIPAGVTAVKPQMKPGWRIEIKTRKPASPTKTPEAAQVGAVIWRGGVLPDAYFDEFGLSMKLPDTPGKTLYFPTVQRCEAGENRWVEIPAAGQAWHDRAHPAPFVKLTPKTESDDAAMPMEHMGH